MLNFMSMVYIKTFTPLWILEYQNFGYTQVSKTKDFSYFSNETYVVGTQKNPHNEMGLFST